MDDYIKVRLPDGSIGRLPSGMSDEEMQEAIAAYKPSSANKPKESKPQSLKEMVLRYGIQEPVAGLAQFGHQLINTPSNIASLMGDKESAEMLSFKPGYDYRKAVGLPAEQDIAGMLIGMAPEITAGMALPSANLGKAGKAISKIPKAGKYLQKIISDALPQAGFAGLMNSPEHAGESAATAGAMQVPFSVASQFAMSPLPERQKLGSLALGTLGGAATGYGLSEMGVPGYVSTPLGAVAGLLGHKAAGTKGMMMERLASGKNPEMAQQRMQAAERLGLDYLTPAEAYNSPYLAREQGALAKTPEGSEMMYEKAQRRVKSEEKAIHALLNDIHNPDIMGPQATKLYQESYQNSLPLESIDKFKNNEIIKQAQKDVMSKAAYREKLKNVPEDSFAYWDHVKKALDDMAEGAPKSEARLINDTKKSLVEEMDTISPQYKEARSLEERKFTRQGLEKALDKAKIHSGEAFYKALQSEEKFNKLLRNTRNVPGAEQKLKDMRELFGDLSKPPSIKTARGLESTGMFQNRNDWDALKHVFENMFTKGKFDKEAVDFITSKDWDKQLAEINKITDKQKRMAKVIEVFGKGVAQGSAKKPYLSTENYDVYE